MEPRISGDYAVQPSLSGADSEHPRIGEYLAYRQCLANQLVRAPQFCVWLRDTQEEEQGHTVVYQVMPGARMAPGWYANVFPPRSGGRHRTYGPFSTEQQANIRGE